MSRNLSDLHPALQPLAERFLDACHAADIDVIITCTYRSNIEQAAAYAKGRTAPGSVVTNAKPGQSRHNLTLNGKPASQAFDVVPLEAGKAIWDAQDPVWQRLGEIGEGLGLEWAGRWTRFREYPHFQITVAE